MTPDWDLPELFACAAWLYFAATTDLAFGAERDSLQQSNQPGRKQQSLQNGRNQQSSQNGRNQQSSQNGKTQQSKGDRPMQTNQNGSRRDSRPRDRRHGTNNRSHSQGGAQFNDTKQTQQQQSRSITKSQPTALLQPSVEEAPNTPISGMRLVLLPPPPVYSAQ